MEREPERTRSEGVINRKAKEKGSHVRHEG